ncbi:MAG: apolipoprotein N-acyltransferase [Spirochaetota bacterium]
MISESAAGKGRSGKIVTLLTEISLLLLSSVLFALSFPSFVSKWGWFPLAYIAIFPVFIVVHRSGWIRIFIYGLFYGYITYALFNFWLAQFHPLSIIIVPTIYAAYFMLLFPILKLADVLFPRYGYLVQLAVWIGYEYLRTTGFLGFAYGIIGYTQYLFLPLIRSASMAGVWGVSVLVIFPSLFIGNALKNGLDKWKEFVITQKGSFFIYFILFIGAVGYGLISTIDLKDTPEWRTALIQHNVDPWKNEYEDSLNRLIRLSQEALNYSPAIVVWSETSFIPAIEYHTRYRDDPTAYDLVKKLTDFLKTQEIPYIIGNDDGQLKRFGGTERLDYNASLLYYKGEFRQKYWKVHLVPFTENFPYRNIFPGIYKWLRNADTHFWEKGTEFTVFEADGIRFSTPICFEDTFGYISRNFVRNGAQIIVNMTNDSWSYSVVSMMQHMSMAVFRAVENRRTVLRSTNGGITCTIDPNGKITGILEPFKEGYLLSEVPVYSNTTTLYTRFGDWLGITAVAAAVALLCFGLVKRRLTIFRKYKKIIR